MTTLGEALAFARQRIDRLDARLLLQYATGCSHDDLLARPEMPVIGPAGEQFVAWVERRAAGEPLAYLVGEAEFRGRVFQVSPAVLIPRPETEVLIELALEVLAGRAAADVVDLGTGSGCLLLSALAEYSNAHGVGVDQSNAALAIATRNAAAQQLSSRVQYVRSNWCSNVSGKFDIVLANPPYIPTAEIATLDADVRTFEPHAALDGGADGLDAYRSILHTLMPHVAAGSLLLFEVGMGQAEDVAALGARAGWQLQEIVHDLAGIARVVALTFPASRNNDIKE